MEVNPHIRPTIKGPQGVWLSASLWLPIELKSYWSREWKQIHEPKGKTHDTSKCSNSIDPLPRDQYAMAFHSHPSWNPSLTAFLVTASSSISFPFPVLPLKNTWAPLLFYCLSTPLKLHVRPCYWALYLSGHSCFMWFKSPMIKSNSKQQCLNIQLFTFFVIHDAVLTACDIIDV